MRAEIARNARTHVTQSRAGLQLHWKVPVLRESPASDTRPVSAGVESYTGQGERGDLVGGSLAGRLSGDGVGISHSAARHRVRKRENGCKSVPVVNELSRADAGATPVERGSGTQRVPRRRRSVVSTVCG